MTSALKEITLLQLFRRVTRLEARVEELERKRDDDSLMLKRNCQLLKQAHKELQRRQETGYCDKHERSYQDDCPQCKNDRAIDSMVSQQAGPGATRAQKRRARETVVGRDF
jgi:hypothetical protein